MENIEKRIKATKDTKSNVFIIRIPYWEEKEWNANNTCRNTGWEPPNTEKGCQATDSRSTVKLKKDKKKWGIF